jgi:purine nucleoside permease
MPAFSAAYQVGSIVVETIVAQWDKYADTNQAASDHPSRLYSTG